LVVLFVAPWGIKKPHGRDVGVNRRLTIRVTDRIVHMDRLMPSML